MAPFSSPFWVDGMGVLPFLMQTGGIYLCPCYGRGNPSLISKPTARPQLTSAYQTGACSRRLLIPQLLGKWVTFGFALFIPKENNGMSSS